MNNIEALLKEMGWDEKLIKAFIGKQRDVFLTPSFYEETPRYVDTATLVISNKDSPEKINLIR